MDVLISNGVRLLVTVLKAWK